MPQAAVLKCFGAIACFLFAFHQKLGHSFVNIKTYCRPAFARGQCQSWWESEGKGKRGMFVCLPAIGACSDCERPLPLLGNIIHQGDLRPDTGEDCLYTLPLPLSKDAYPFLRWNQPLNAKQFSSVTELVCGAHIPLLLPYWTQTANWLACLNSLIGSCIFWYSQQMASGWMEEYIDKTSTSSWKK